MTYLRANQRISHVVVIDTNVASYAAGFRVVCMYTQQSEPLQGLTKSELLYRLGSKHCK